MGSWTKKQRVAALMSGEAADRPPVMAWQHFVGLEKRAEDLVRAEIEFQHKYDWDLLKINPRAVYYHEVWGNEYDYSKYNGVIPACTRKTIESSRDLYKITEKSSTNSILREQISIVRKIVGAIGDDVPVLQTVFTPIGVLLNLCGARSLGRYREAPREESPIIRLFKQDRAGVHRALLAIANTLADYVASILAAGADGIFYAALGMSREGYMTLDEWEEFVRPYDLIVLDALRNHFAILHTCGMFSNPQRFADYPVQIIHWAETAPGNTSLAASVDWIGDKAIMGGVNEQLFGTGAAEQIAACAAHSVQAHARRPFILAPECSVAPNTSEDEYRALRAAVES